jgi:hydrogenase/urease accessory protein HupE
VQLTLLDERNLTGTRMLLGPGERSAPWRLDEPPPDAGQAGAAQPGTIARYMALGFEHILPLGADHVLFVVGLFLLAARWRPLLWQVSAFTLAHTLSLALSMAGMVSLPSPPVETLIAASIAYVAIENLITNEMHIWRPLLVFVFGLLHGLGFAGVLRELGLPEGEWIPALISFNAGVELGQLTVIGLAFLAVGWFRDRSWYRPWIVRPTSAAIALIGLYWAVERGLGL